MSVRQAEKYERLYPETGIGEAQKEERMQRLEFNHERQALRRTGRNRGITVPRLPASMEPNEETT